MKKLKLLLLLPSILLASCGLPDAEATENYKTSTYSNFIVLCTHTISNVERLEFILDPYTQNIYVTTTSSVGDGKGGITPYYNAEGKIMKYEEFKVVHVH